MDIKSAYQKIESEIISIRRKIHSEPECDFNLFKTAETICSFLDKYSISYTSGIAKCGILALIGNPGKGKTVLIRADMDALETEEKTNLSYASKVKGKMHACGHDFHIANALAAAFILKEYENELKGCVKIAFQPAEETTGGAEPMIKEGILENPHVDYCIGAHVSAMHETGEMIFKSGSLMASPDDFDVLFKGKSTHGAEPQNGINPIPAACEFVLKIKSFLEKEISFDENVFSICMLQSGNSKNIIPDEALVCGTFRSFNNSDRKKADLIMKNHAQEIALKYGCEYDFKYNYLFPPLINDRELTLKAIECAKKVIGKEKIKNFEKPLMTGEDFSYFAIERPSVFAWAGCSPEGKKIPLHSSEFQGDEKVIEIVSQYFCELTLELLK